MERNFNVGQIVQTRFGTSNEKRFIENANIRIMGDVNNLGSVEYYMGEVLGDTGVFVNMVYNDQTRKFNTVDIIRIGTGRFKTVDDIAQFFNCKL